MGPSRSYLASNEHRKEARGTEFCKHKMRVTIVMCVNAKKMSLGPWCLSTDNSSLHELFVDLDLVSIIYPPSYSTSKHQPWEPGLVAAPKICYRTKLRDATLPLFQRYQVLEFAYKINSGRGKWGLREGHFFTLQTKSNCLARLEI